MDGFDGLDRLVRLDGLDCLDRFGLLMLKPINSLYLAPLASTFFISAINQKIILLEIPNPKSPIVKPYTIWFCAAI